MIKALRIGTDQTDSEFYAREFIATYGKYASIAWEADELVFTYRTEQIERINDRDGAFFVHLTLTPKALPHLIALFAFASHLPEYFRQRRELHFRAIEKYIQSAEFMDLEKRLKGGLLTGGGVPGIFTGQWAAALSERIDYFRCLSGEHHALYSETDLSHYDKLAVACCHLKTYQGRVSIPLTNDPFLTPKLFEQSNAIVLNKQLFSKLETFLERENKPSFTERLKGVLRKKQPSLPQVKAPVVCQPHDIFDLPSGPFVFSQGIKALAQLFAPEEISEARTRISKLTFEGDYIIKKRIEEHHNDLAVHILLLDLQAEGTTITYPDDKNKELCVRFEGGGINIYEKKYSVVTGDLAPDNTVNIMALTYKLWNYLNDNHVLELEVK